MTPVMEIGVSASYGHGWRQMKRHFGVLLAVTVVILIVGSVSGFYQESESDYPDVLGMAFQIFVYGPISYGGFLAFLNAARDSDPRFGDLFAGFGNYVNVVLANVLVWLTIGVGFLLLIIPGIYFTCKLALTPYLVMDRKMPALDAIKESWRLTDGHAWTVFLMGLLAIPIAIAGLICFGVGIIVSIMWISLAFAALYLAIIGAAGPGDTVSSAMSG